MSASPTPRLSASLLAPRHWPTWLGVSALWLIGRLPPPLWRALGRGLGCLAMAMRNPRRHVAARNIALCFPELDSKRQRDLLDAHVRDIGMMVVEFAVGWMASDRAVARLPVSIEGIEHIEAARAAGRGIVLLGGHFSHLELCGRLLSRHVGIAGMYRRMDSTVLEWMVLRARLRYASAMFNREDLRGTLRFLRKGGTLWYAPDHDVRGKKHIFVPFFGIPAATITATHHLARLSGALVLPFFHRRHADGSYSLRIEAPLEHMPSDDANADTAKINNVIERMVRQAPSQYLWMYRRFKRRPPGSDAVY